MGHIIFGIILAIPLGLLIFYLIIELRKNHYENYWKDVIRGLGIYLVCLLLTMPIVVIIALISFNLPYILQSTNFSGHELITAISLLAIYGLAGGAIGILEFYLWMGYKRGLFRRHVVRATFTECIILSLTYMFHVFLNFDFPI
jgi:hypothetical protein